MSDFGKMSEKTLDHSIDTTRVHMKISFKDKKHDSVLSLHGNYYIEMH